MAVAFRDGIVNYGRVQIDEYQEHVRENGDTCFVLYVQTDFFYSSSRDADEAPVKVYGCL